jgi:hypothetical protein
MRLTGKGRVNTIIDLMMFRPHGTKAVTLSQPLAKLQLPLASSYNHSKIMNEVGSPTEDFYLIAGRVHNKRFHYDERTRVSAVLCIKNTYSYGVKND